MHKVLNVKHRIVRRIDAGRAPLATFDTIDLGDEVEKDTHWKSNATNNHINQEGTSSNEGLEIRLCDVGISKPETIGGNHSKKALSQAGGEGKEEKAVDPLKENQEDCQNSNNAACDTQPCRTGSSAVERVSDEKEINLGDKDEELSNSPKKDSKEEFVLDNSKKSSAPLAAANLSRQGTLGRVSIPIKKQSSVSSSSSSEACNDSHFTFTTSRPSIAHLDSAEGGYDLPDSVSHRSSVSNLVPDNIDPNQILSPSKRKAYEKRLERLKVTTSPIARPRSNAPINVVTLDEYANISSPEHSPLLHSVLQDKLKITLPCDEFTKSPKVSCSSRRKDSEDTCFEFSEEILFRCTKSALVVDEDGQLPVSPRRVLIPPTITPTNSPKLSSSPRFSTHSSGEVIESHGAPKLIYMKEDDATHKLFGLTFDEAENENWADFPDSSVNLEKADTEYSEKDELNGNLCVEDHEDSTGLCLVTEEPLTDVNANNDLIADEPPHSSQSVSLSDHQTSDICLKIESKESNECLELTQPSKDISDNSTSLVVDTVNIEDTLVEEITQPEVDNGSFFNNTKTVDISVENIAEKCIDSTICSVAEHNQIISNETNNIVSTEEVIHSHLSNSIVDAEKPVSFPEGFIGDSINKSYDHIIISSGNPFTLLDAPTNQDEASVILPIPLSSSNLQSTTKDNQTNTFSVSLNPFLQDLPTTTSLFDTSNEKDIDKPVDVVNVESLNLQISSQESEPSHNLNISTAKSSSSSTDLIDFSSSLDLDLPPPPPLQ